MFPGLASRAEKTGRRSPMTSMSASRQRNWPASTSEGQGVERRLHGRVEASHRPALDHVRIVAGGHVAAPLVGVDQHDDQQSIGAAAAVGARDPRRSSSSGSEPGRRDGRDAAFGPRPDLEVRRICVRARQSATHSSGASAPRADPSQTAWQPFQWQVRTVSSRMRAPRNVGLPAGARRSRRTAAAWRRGGRSARTSKSACVDPAERRR